ncbi:MAG: biotin transporter BioY, partial [Gemmatimonadales bacterium]|nr:biotin transporter BioY [Gemmatimonadales bacterium]
MTTLPSATTVSSRVLPHLRRALLVTVGAMLVALAAQFAVPLPGTPVPMTLQPLAVLIVGGLLGPGYGALSLAVYLEMGAVGLPVFTPLGAPGLARLFGPTGGFLLAYPMAAALVGWVVQRNVGTSEGDIRSAVPSFKRSTLAALAGIVTIHVGGAAQLLVLTGSAQSAIAMGLVPFILGDLLKV